MSDPAGADTSIPACFAAQVRRRGEHVAVRTLGSSLTYAELNARANRIAHALLAARGPQAEPVALVLDKGPSQLPGLLGIWKAGKIAAPLDPGLPPERLRVLLAQAEIDVVLGLPVAVVRDVGRPGALVLNADAASAKGPDHDPALAIEPGAPAYLLHTSGSTGRPRGVLHTHRTTLHQWRNATKAYGFTADERAIWLAALQTGQGMTNCVLALLNGATLYPWDIRRQGLHTLAGWMRDERVTWYRSSASVFRYFVEGLGADTLPALRFVALASEPVYASDLERFRARFPAPCRFVNSLSTTESGTLAVNDVDRDTPLPERLVPVGRPPDGMEVLLLGEDGAPVPPGEPGEIVARSRHLAEGYWRDPDRTRASFGPDPEGSDARVYHTGDLGRIGADGLLVHLGRRDFQVKVRGHRVEMEEVELTLRQHPAVRAAAVVARPDARGETALTGYVVPDAPPGPGETALRRFLAERLPGHMVPGSIVALDALPMTGAGKIDRVALLEAPATTTRARIAPRSPIETRIAAMWAAVLGVDEVGVEDDFLELGGNSLLATRVVTRVLQDLGVDVPVGPLLSAATVADMALVIVTELAGRAPGSLSP